MTEIVQVLFAVAITVAGIGTGIGLVVALHDVLRRSPVGSGEADRGERMDAGEIACGIVERAHVGMDWLSGSGDVGGGDGLGF